MVSLKARSRVSCHCTIEESGVYGQYQTHASGSGIEQGRTECRRMVPSDPRKEYGFHVEVLGAHETGERGRNVRAEGNASVSQDFKVYRY
jgi:hypothetical protein